jgi:hypothetical protein
MKLGGGPIGARVVAPLQQPGSAFQRVERARARADVEKVSRDRGRRKDSAARLEGPERLARFFCPRGGNESGQNHREG